MITKITDTAYCDETGVMPWFTIGCLEWLSKQDLSQKTILEFGSGASTAWFAKRCKRIVSIEADKNYFPKTIDAVKGLNNVHISLRECNEGDQSKVDFYCDERTCESDFNPHYDIVIVDGVLRNECLQKGIEILGKNGGLIIADNWKQAYVWMSEAAEKLMEPYKRTVYEQADHTNNDGVNKWKTVVFEIPKR